MKYTDVMIKKSNYLSEYLNAPAKGRRSFISSEFADYGKTTAMAMTPDDKSLFILLPLYYPEIFMHSESESDKRVCKGIINYIAQTTKSIDGIQDKQLDKVEVEYKNQFFNAPLFTNITGATKEITFNVPADVGGYGVIDFLNHWNNQISDEYTNFAPYNGLNIEWNNWSHSCGFAYLKPSKSMTKLSWGALWFQCVFTTIPYSNFNADRMSPGVADLSLTASVCMIDSRNLMVREVLESMLAKYKAIFCEDSSQHGMIKGTFHEAIDDIDPEDVVNNLVIKS